MIKPPSIPFEVSDLPEDIDQRHEALVDVFGSMLFSMRHQALARIALLINSEEARKSLGRIFREPYEAVASLPEKDQSASLRLAEASVDLFAKLLLTMLADKGKDHKFGTGHSINFRLELEVMDDETERTVLEDTLNRGGENSLPGYWGRWLNRFGGK